jgi:hypothetical protein
MPSNPLSRLSALAATRFAARRTRPDRGQTTSEYALVLLGAAAIALLLVAWATGSGKVDQLFNAVFDRLISHAR